MGMTACWKALRIAGNVVHQVALEAAAARWAVALQGEEMLSPPTQPFYKILAALIPPPGEDQSLSEDVTRLAKEIEEGRMEIHGL